MNGQQRSHQEITDTHTYTHTHTHTHTKLIHSKLVTNLIRDSDVLNELLNSIIIVVVVVAVIYFNYSLMKQ